ncbi:GNAT family N-acetyltransferase [Pseudomonas sp. Hp2]|uniref:GNAT family N-acetyltransferase n=1 Tax=Pseudomonas sp. Hp2 TaxID=701189 RepID=UPI00112921FA|nr:GNAT family N-acetyltransferase [Pseudomonas sp. Hp2]
MSTAGESQVRHEPGRFRFVTHVGGHEAVLEYRLAAGTMAILHTGVPEPIGGRGIAGQLTAAALATARANGWKVRPECSYAEAYFRRHPEQRDLLA